MSDVGSDRCRNTQGFLTKKFKEIFWDLKFLSEVTGCRKTQVSDRMGSTVLINCQAMITHEIHSAYLFPMGFFTNNSLSG